MGDRRLHPRIRSFFTAKAASKTTGPPAPFKIEVVSFSADGCAIRTATRLAEGDRVTLELPTERKIPGRSIRLEGTVVWHKNDFRIDTFYANGLRFSQSLKPEQLEAIRKAQFTIPKNPIA
jgi:hypothetical protein